MERLEDADKKFKEREAKKKAYKETDEYKEGQKAIRRANKIWADEQLVLHNEWNRKNRAEILRKKLEEEAKQKKKKFNFIIKPNTTINDILDSIPTGMDFQKLSKAKIEELISKLKHSTNGFVVDKVLKLEKRLNQIEAIKGKGGRPKKDTTEIDRVKAEKKAEKEAKKAEKDNRIAEEKTKKAQEKKRLKEVDLFQKKMRAEIDAKKKKEVEDRAKLKADRMAKLKTQKPKKKVNNALGVAKPRGKKPFRSEIQLAHLAKMREGKAKALAKRNREALGLVK